MSTASASPAQTTSPKRRILSVFGTRPEAIKFAPVIRALQAAQNYESIVAVTGQHREMLDQVLDLFDIKPDVDLDIHELGQSLAQVTIRSVAGLDEVLVKHRPDMVIVQGDTTTTLAGALVSFYRGIPVTHLEAGLRTGDRQSPFPEEINRRVTSQLTTLHLAPTPTNVSNLVREGVSRESVICTGNTVIDALNQAVDMRVGYADSRLAILDDDDRNVLLVTVHRRESWGSAMDSIGRALGRIASHEQNLLVIPIHPNPLVRQSILPPLSGRENVVICEPLPYGSFARLIDRATLILTDSGGIQEEAPSRGKPVLVLRNTTERPEAVAAGTVEVVGTDEDFIYRRTMSILTDRVLYNRMAEAINPYGDGAAAMRSLAALDWYFGDGPRPVEFHSE